MPSFPWASSWYQSQLVGLLAEGHTKYGSQRARLEQCRTTTHALHPPASSPRNPCVLESSFVRGAGFYAPGGHPVAIPLLVYAPLGATSVRKRGVACYSASYYCAGDGAADGWSARSRDTTRSLVVALSNGSGDTTVTRNCAMSFGLPSTRHCRGKGCGVWSGHV